MGSLYLVCLRLAGDVAEEEEEGLEDLPVLIRHEEDGGLYHRDAQLLGDRCCIRDGDGRKIRRDELKLLWFQLVQFLWKIYSFTKSVVTSFIWFCKQMCFKIKWD